jgi:outer membrane biosynthesis protein TonB
VKFLVDKKGNVERAQIVEIYRLNKEGERTKKVQNINSEIKKVVLKAAMNWKFKPAKDQGKPVRSYTRNYFII